MYLQLYFPVQTQVVFAEYITLLHPHTLLDSSSSESSSLPYPSAI